MLCVMWSSPGWSRSSGWFDRLRWVRVLGLGLMVLGVASCDSTSRPAAGVDAHATGGEIVIDFDNGSPHDLYTAVSLAGTTSRTLGIAGYLRAGFNRALTKAAVVEGGAMNGSAADQSTLGVGPLGSPHRRVIWRFVDDVDFPLSWNPSGTQLAVGLSASFDRSGNQHSDPPSGLWVVSTSGSSRRRLVQGDVGPVAWSPDGKTIAFMPTTLETLNVVPAAGGPSRTIATLPLGTSLFSYANPTLSWSPDGRQIAVAYTQHTDAPQNHLSQVAVYPAGGGSPRTLVGPSSDLIYTGASFSPDGTELAVTILRPVGSTASDGRTSPTTAASNAGQAKAGFLDVVNVEGGYARPIATYERMPLMIGWEPG